MTRSTLRSNQKSLGLPDCEAGVAPGPARAVIAHAGVSRRKPSLRPPASPGQSSLLSLPRRDGSTQIFIINCLMFLDALLLAESMHNPGWEGSRGG
jgi:hypothetical protein